jgi:hypothetical protein
MTSSHSSRLLVCPDSHFLILGYCISTWSPLSHSVEASLMVICRVDEGMFARLSTSSALQTMYRLYYLVFSVCLKLWYLLLIIIIALPICSNFWLNLFWWKQSRLLLFHWERKKSNDITGKWTRIIGVGRRTYYIWPIKWQRRNFPWYSVLPHVFFLFLYTHSWFLHFLLYWIFRLLRIYLYYDLRNLSALFISVTTDNNI